MPEIPPSAGVIAPASTGKGMRNSILLMAQRASLRMCRIGSGQYRIVDQSYVAQVDGHGGDGPAPDAFQRFPPRRRGSAQFDGELNGA